MGMWNDTIGLHFGTYLSEVYRGALEGVPKTQWEACRALNFSTFYTTEKLFYSSISNSYSWYGKLLSRNF